MLVLEVDGGDPAVPLLRQRRRLGDTLADFSDAQWRTESRCAGWSAADVVAHLVGTNQFWAASFGAGFRGEPTRFLSTFDPVTTPPLMVDAMRTLAPAELLAQYLDTVDALAAVVSGLDESTWATPAEAPPGHISARAVSLHALWDAWIHERDIVLPLGLDHVVEDDEVIGCLQYVAAIGPAFLASTGSTREGSLTIEATAPDVAFTVDAGSTVVVRAGTGEGARLCGDAVALVEGLSYRAPLHDGLGDDDRWLLGGLGDVFDVAS